MKHTSMPSFTTISKYYWLATEMIHSFRCSYLHGLDGLRSRVVKLTSLTNREATRTQYKHLWNLSRHKKMWLAPFKQPVSLNSLMFRIFEVEPAQPGWSTLPGPWEGCWALWAWLTLCWYSFLFWSQTKRHQRETVGEKKKSLITTVQVLYQQYCFLMVFCSLLWSQTPILVKKKKG